MLKASFRNAGLIWLNLLKVNIDPRAKASEVKQDVWQSKVKLACVLSQFMSLLSFFTPWKLQKTSGRVKIRFVKTPVS